MTTTFITGANRGIGLELARIYTDHEFDVFAGCRNPGTATDLEQVQAGASTDFEILELDVTDDASVAAAARTVGDRPVDILINNAGVYGPRNEQTIGSYDFEAWQRVLDTNVLGPARVTQALLANLRRSERRLVATVSSQLGSIARSSGGIHLYRSSKAAVNAVMRALAKDLAADGVTVLLLHPGWVSTDMGGARAPVTPRESAEGLFSVLSSASYENSGTFLDWNGEAMPW